MERKLKVLLDAEIVDDKTKFELQGGSGRITYSFQACGGGGGCGGGGRCPEEWERNSCNSVL